jgi:GTPase SAR1 family protein
VRGVRLDQPTRTALFGATKLLKERGLPDVARFALQRLQPGQQTAPTVVVVGEVKRGKSSLVNALLGRPGLSPVGVDVATDCFLRFAPPQPDLPDGTARAVLAGERRSIEPAEIGAWASAGGAHTDPSGEEPLVRGVEVGIDARWTPGLELVDTPGVGGLAGAHARIARQSAAWASLLVFVSDCGQPLTSNELGFLATLSESVDGVVLVMTKKDLYPAGWREVAAENRRLLRRHAPRFAEVDIKVVSSSLAATAAGVPNPATADALLAASGIPDLGALLVARAGNPDRTSVANALRTVRTGLDQVTAQLELRRRAASGSPELLDDLQEERARLERLAGQQSRWNLDLDRDMGAVRARAIALANREFGDIRDRWTVRIAKDRLAMLPAGRRQMMAEISVELEAAAARVAAAFYQQLYVMVQQLFADVATAESMYRVVSPELGRLQPPPRPLRPSGVSKLDPSLVTTAFFGVSMAKGMFGVAAGASLLSPFILPLAGGWLAVNVTYRVIKGGRTQLQAWLLESVQAVQAELVATTDNVIRDFRPEIVVGFREFLATATAQVKLSIKEAEAAATNGRREREQRIAALDRHLAVVEAQRAEVDRALTRTAEAPPQTAPALPAAVPAAPAAMPLTSSAIPETSLQKPGTFTAVAASENGTTGDTGSAGPTGSRTAGEQP